MTYRPYKPRKPRAVVEQQEAAPVEEQKRRSRPRSRSRAESAPEAEAATPEIAAPSAGQPSIYAIPRYGFARWRAIMTPEDIERLRKQPPCWEAPDFEDRSRKGKLSALALEHSFWAEELEELEDPAAIRACRKKLAKCEELHAALGEAEAPKLDAVAPPEKKKRKTYPRKPRATR